MKQKTFYLADDIDEKLWKIQKDQRSISQSDIIRVGIRRLLEDLDEGRVDIEAIRQLDTDYDK